MEDRPDGRRGRTCSPRFDRLQRAQDRLDEAIKNGASPEEIDQLMKEMQQALNEYMRELAEEAQRNPGDQQQQGQMQGQMMSGDQLQEMLDKLQQLMEEGKTAEAAELMEQLRQLMENMQVVAGPGQGQGQGQGSPASKACRTWARRCATSRNCPTIPSATCRASAQGDQQGAGAWRRSRGRSQGQDSRARDQGEDGHGEAAGRRSGQGEGSALTDRQRDLRERLNDLQHGELPGDGTEQGEEGRRNLDRAGRAMEEAEEALRDGDLDGALDRQAEAMEALRDGMQDFGEALAEEQRAEPRRPGRRAEFGSRRPERHRPAGPRTGRHRAHRLGREHGAERPRHRARRNFWTKSAAARAT